MRASRMVYRHFSIIGGATLMFASVMNAQQLSITSGTGNLYSGGSYSTTTGGIDQSAIYVIGSGTQAEVYNFSAQATGNAASGIYVGSGATLLLNWNHAGTGTIYGAGGGSTAGLRVDGGTVQGKQLTINYSDLETFGVYATSGGLVDLQDSTISNMGSGAYALFASGSGSRITGNNLSISVSGSDTGIWGASVNNGGIVSLTGGSITATNSNRAVNVDGTGSLFEAINLQITSTNFGIISTNNGSVSLSGGFINTTNNTTLRASGGSVITANSVNVSSAGSYGLGATLLAGEATAGTVNFNGGSVTSLIYGANASAGGTIRINVDSSNAPLASSTLLKTTGNTGYGLYATGSGSNITAANLTVNTAGTRAYGIHSIAGGKVTVSNSAITTGSSSNASEGTEGSGLHMDGASSDIATNGGVSITTYGADAHGIRVSNGKVKTYDGSAGNVFPGITVYGNGAAVINASASGSQLTLKNYNLSTAMTAGAGTWGAKAENGGTITFDQNASSGATALWASAGGIITFNANAAANGSRVVIDTGSQLDLSNTGSGLTIGSLEGGGNVALGARDLTVGGSVTAADSASTTYSGSIGGTGNFVKQGTGTLTLGGANAYTGNTVLNGGSIKGGAANVIAASSALVVSANTTFDTGNFVQTVRNLQGAGHVIAGNSVTMNSTADSTFSGDVSGTGGFVKTGSGTFTLTGTSNAYAGSASVNQGSVIVDGQWGNAGSALAVNTGALLAGNGIIGGNVTVSNNATLAPGRYGSASSPAMLTIGGVLTLNGGSVFDWQTGDLVKAATLSLTGGSPILVNLDGWSGGTVVLAEFDNLLGFDWETDDANDWFALNIANNPDYANYNGLFEIRDGFSLVYTDVIPEPSAYGFFSLMAALLGAAVRRRRRVVS